MEIIVADKNGMEIGYLQSNAELDMDLSADADNQDGVNDAELTVPSDAHIDYGYYLFCPGAEYGGRILDLKRSTSSLSSVWYVNTWRKMLGQSIIEPPEGQAYMEVSGDANEVLRALLSSRFGDFFSVLEELSGIEISGKFDRYTPVLDGLNKLLAAHGARLKIQALQGGSGEAFTVQLSAVPVVDYSEEIEYSQDNRINLTIRDNRRGINHLICLGSGELTERMVRHLYVQEGGSIGSTQYFTGLDERTVVFEYPNAEDEEDLLTAGEEELRELMNYKKLEMTVQDLDLEIGDIIAGRDRVTGAYLKKPIVNKILKIKKGKETISYKVKGDS